MKILRSPNLSDSLKVKNAIRILFVHYFFPPRGGAAVQRLVKLCKYLARYGFKPYVLTSGAKYGVIDKSLMTSIPEQTIIYNTYDSDKCNAIEGQFGRKNVFIDGYALWIPAAIKKARKIIKTHNIDVLFITSPPHSQQLIGLRLKKTTGLPWVADFRDPWTSDLRFMEQKSKCLQMLDKWAEKQVLRNADLVLATAPSAVEAFRRKLNDPYTCRKIKWLPNGYDPEDYSNKKKTASPEEKIIFTYVGSAGPMISDPTYFFKALRFLLDKEPEIAPKITIRFLGGLAPESRQLLKSLNLDKIVEFLGFLSRDKAMEYMVRSHILLLFEYPVGTGQEPTRVIPSKIFEYMGARRQVMAMAVEGDTVDIMRKYQLGTVVDPYSIENIAEAIRKHIQLFENQDSVSLPLSPDIFNRRRQVRELAEAIDQLVNHSCR
jgi:glycosyltransferase involved in cell wall biosynthesis